MEIQGKEIIASENKYIHRIGNESYFKRSILLQDETLDNFEEVDSIPEQESEEKIAFRETTENKIKTLALNSYIKSNINTFSLTDNESLAVVDYYPEWQIDIDVKENEKYKVGKDLWKCIKSHRTQENWKPGIETASLWVRVDETHEGTIDDPIPFKIPMEIFINKYYIEDGITYKCIRDSGIALNNTLNSLVNIYVEKI